MQRTEILMDSATKQERNMQKLSRPLCKFTNKVIVCSFNICMYIVQMKINVYDVTPLLKAMKEPKTLYLLYRKPSG